MTAVTDSLQASAEARLASLLRAHAPLVALALLLVAVDNSEDALEECVLLFVNRSDGGPCVLPASRHDVVAVLMAEGLQQGAPLESGPAPSGHVRFIFEMEGSTLGADLPLRNVMRELAAAAAEVVWRKR